MHKMKVHLEYLYHYKCEECGGWWSVADKAPQLDKLICCPHCAAIHQVESITAHAIAPIVTSTEIPD